MAVERKVINVNVSRVGSSAYEDVFKAAWDTAISGAGASDYHTVYVEKCQGSREKDRYIILVEKSS